MLKNRFFNVLIVIALVMAVALTAREAFATADIVSQGNAADAAKTAKCAILPPQMSIETVYVAERGIWVTYSGQGPTGVDGGLMDILSKYRTCSR